MRGQVFDTLVQAPSIWRVWREVTGILGDDEVCLADYGGGPDRVIVGVRERGPGGG